MLEFDTKFKNNSILLALGAESAGNFSVFRDGKIFFSQNFGDLLEEKNWQNFQQEVLKFLKNNKLKPNFILTDLHPDFRTTLWGEKLAKKFKAKHIQVQHHLAHTFSSIGDKLISNSNHKLIDINYSIVMDGTGLGTDGKIWGGEVFKIDLKNKKIERIGHLENQFLLGGELAIKEPARMLIGILKKCYPRENGDPVSKLKASALDFRFRGNDKKEIQKKSIYKFLKKYYSQNEFELLWNQLEQKFNCPETSSAGRILDTVSILLGFCQNERNFKHEPTILLEKNSTQPFSDLKPKIIKKNILNTTYLLSYVLAYVRKRDKKRLAATVQNYIVEGLFKIVSNCHSRLDRESSLPNIFASGGLSTNKIISEYLKSQNVYLNKKIPAGDAGISFGQIVFYLSTDPRD